MTTIATLITHADIPEHVRGLLAVLPWAGTVVELAERLGVVRRSALRALAAAKSLGLVTRDGGYVLTRDAESILRSRCHHVGRKREAPGLEYTPLADVDAARDDRARWFYRRGSGPKWAMERGAKLAREEA